MAPRVVESSPLPLEPVEVLLPWAARGASVILTELRGDSSAGQGGWLRREIRGGAETRLQPIIPDVLRLSFAGLHAHWTAAGAPLEAALRTPIDLLHWCERPLADWPIELEGCPYDRDEPIIDRASATLTDFGEELARASDRRLDALLADEAVFDLLRTTASEHPDTDVYGPFRRFLIEHPVLVEDEFRRFRADLPSRLVESARTLLELAYRPWGASGTQTLAICRRCRNLLASGDGPLRCVTPWCAEVDGGRPAELRVPAGCDWFEQRRGVRLYIGLPGLAELDLERQLVAIGDIGVDLWPGPPGAPDAYDLAVRFATGEVWAADVKDHQRPFRLGHTTEIPTVFGTETRRLLVVPAWRMSRPDYRRRARAQVTAPGIELVDSDELVLQALRKVKDIKRRAAP